MARKTKIRLAQNPYKVRENDPGAVFGSDRRIAGRVTQQPGGMWFAVRDWDGNTTLTRTRFHAVNFILGKS